MTEPLHEWSLSPAEARSVQNDLRSRVWEAPVERVETVGGLDVSIREDRARAAAVVMALGSGDEPALVAVDHTTWEGPVPFPYVPGLLSFREMPALLPAIESLSAQPDVWLLDGHGRAHPRRFGLACHLGVWLGRPAIGVAKNRLVGVYDEPGTGKGSATDLRDGGEVIGRVVRTRTNVKPVFVSVGHRISLSEAERLVLRLATRYKLPMPTHLAHRLSYHGTL